MAPRLRLVQHNNYVACFTAMCVNVRPEIRPKMSWKKYFKKFGFLTPADTTTGDTTNKTQSDHNVGVSTLFLHLVTGLYKSDFRC